MNLRERRIEGEWEQLQTLAAANPGIFVAIERVPGEFHVTFANSPAWIRETGEPHVRAEHVLRYVFPRYYPTLPLDAYFMRPVFHPNVDQENGFACLWHEYRPGLTIIDAVQITRSIMAHRCVNQDPAHCMQPGAYVVYELDIPSMIIPACCSPALPAPRSGRRLRITPTLPEE
ncbi:ubiquitin-conjugating enzyme E2 [Granulicella sp. S190]|uniref:ubiquitin-conjugating enzyme E2 n=1 Tax=Granulicella sp. S190 TaxID=1747226 RepID=UPI00131D7C36|nr:ubiquitin-conjugating enzyme E2 [Granulicella sp. S190]